MEIQISIDKQELTLWENGILRASYPVSTGKNGVGEQSGSEQTPRGKHYIRAKIGAGAPLGMAFKGRDWITSRIWWLCGREIGKNRLGTVDTFHRYIYIHGTPDWEPMGIPLSHGCIRMRNTDIVELFDLIPPFTSVIINE